MPRISRSVRALRERLAPAPKRNGGPSSALFTGIRRRLTLQYLGILAALLLVGGGLLYFVVHQALLGPVQGYLEDSAQQFASAWQQRPDPDCGLIPISAQAYQRVYQHVPYVVCFGLTGIQPYSTTTPPPELFSTTLAQAALDSKTGDAFDTVIAGHGFGAIESYALVVHNPATGQIIGVVQVGIPIQGSLDALNTLAISLVLVGLLTLVGAAVASMWLSGRAMAPAHLAFERQQAFIGDAAHELRTPLTLMRADAEVLLRGRERLAPEDAELLEDIVAETAHMGALTTNMLTLARLDAGAQRVERDVVDLGAVAAVVARRVAALAAERGIALHVEAPEKVLVVGDRALLEQAALILVDNAVKYNRPGGSVTMRVAREGPRALLEVRDTGIGIPPDQLPRLGERFYRVDKARSREQGGAGLGLSIARGIAGVHGGAVTLASVPGEGTTATLSLPAGG